MHYVPYIAILVAFALVYLPRQIVSFEMKKLSGGYDNRDPRGQQAQLDGLGKRALAAHHNSFEAFAPFAAGVLAAVQRQASVEAVAYVSIGFVVVRAGYIYAYIADRSTVRSTLWGFGIAATATLMGLAIAG